MFDGEKRVFKLMAAGFISNKKEPNLKNFVADLLENNKLLGYNMSPVNVHFLHSYLNYFPENLGAVSQK